MNNLAQNSLRSCDKNPLVNVISVQAKLMVSLGARLYLDPVSRHALRAPAEKASSKFGDLLTGREERGRRFDA